jgi:alpha-2-macroglobulin
LTTEIRDLYGFLIDGMQGTRGAIRSGGDSTPELAGERPTQEPLARFSGIVKTGPDGKARIDFDLPAFNGTLKVMAVAWTKTKAGSASTEVIVRDPVVALVTAPRFLALGDRPQFSVEIENVEGKPGDYALDLDVTGPLSAAPDVLHRKFKLAAGARKSLMIPVTATGVGRASVDRYPYGCSEQIVSGALSLLYVNKLAKSEALGIDPDVDQRIREAIERVLARQDSNGAFGVWSATDADDMWLHAFVTDFLTRARENKFDVPQKKFDAALERLRNLIANANDIGAGQGAPIAYAAYVLARNGREVMGVFAI